MPFEPLALLRLGRGPVGAARERARSAGPAADQAEAEHLVRTITTLRSSLDRATVLAAVRHELRLPLGAEAVPAGALHLERATDSSVTVASVRRRSCFRGELVVRDVDGGSTGEYTVDSWHEQRGRICDADQLRCVREAIVRAVLGVDRAAQIHLRHRPLER